MWAPAFLHSGPRLDMPIPSAYHRFMKPRSLPAQVFAGLLLLLPLASHADDLAAMAGKWKLESAEAGGKPIDPPELRDLVVTITEDRYEVQTKDGPDRGTLKLDEKTSPKTMDATDTEGQDAGKVIRAIYEMKDDTMKVCYALSGDQRPTQFATEEGAPFLLVVYRREK